jgi:hypothetical protein
VRLWVRTPGGTVMGAIARKSVLNARFGAAAGDTDALAIYQAHRAQVDAAVLRRIAAGSLEPVLLREADFGERGAKPVQG